MEANELRKLSENVVRLQEKVSTLEAAVKDLVTRAEFTPVKLIVYGIACATLSGVLAAVLAQVVTK